MAICLIQWEAAIVKDKDEMLVGGLKCSRYP